MTPEEWAALCRLLWRTCWIYSTPSERRELLAIQERIEAAAKSGPVVPA